jgi:hypothetical protein
MNAAMFRESTVLRTSRLLLSAIAVVALVAASLTGCAHLPWARQDTGPAGPATITGHVTSDRGAILADAGITLSGPSFRRTARTDVAGRFTFERVPLGSYVVSAAAAGYKSAKQTISVDKEATVRADLTLKM